MRKAAPLMNTLAHVVAVKAITSMDQRRAVLIDDVGMPPWCHGYPMILNLNLNIWTGHGNVDAARRVATGPH
jgi:hypothetical protein